jgi:mitochondrial import receptor subunit TOM20
LKRESRRQARIAKEEAEIQGKQQQEEIKRAVEETLEEGFPTDLEEREAYFMSQISQGEEMSANGKEATCLSSLNAETNGPTGSDPVAAALCFYKGLKVYPEPKALISIYDNTVPKDILEILATMVAQDKSLKIGGFGGSGGDGSGSESGHGVE